VCLKLMGRNYINIAFLQQCNTGKKLTEGGYPILYQEHRSLAANHRPQIPKNGLVLIVNKDQLVLEMPDSCKDHSHVLVIAVADGVLIFN
jgi:hypothetical protein